MAPNWKAALAAGFVALTGCGQERTNEAAEANAPAAEAAGTEVNAEGPPGVSATNETEAPATNDVSSGMPVPGTNTPEMIVVNNTAGPNPPPS